MSGFVRQKATSHQHHQQHQFQRWMRMKKYEAIKGVSVVSCQIVEMPQNSIFIWMVVSKFYTSLTGQ